MHKPISVIHGPNLNALGRREAQIYGTQTLEDLYSHLTQKADAIGTKLQFFQSNLEGELVGEIQRASAECGAIIINPGAFSHTSIAVLDALLTFKGPIVEVHLSNIHQRESFRHTSLTSRAARGIIAGFGFQGYELALQACVEELAKNSPS